jgi:calcineurin-like phosphoesterase family protein
VKGNHDIFNKKGFYEKYFESVHGVRVFPYDFVCTHVPVHPSCLERDSWPNNLHGHLHEHTINSDPRYLNVSVEQINYTPIPYEEVMERFKTQKENK